MRKRISCRVIRSIPLSKSSDILHHTSMSNDSYHKMGPEPSQNAQVRYCGNAAIYIDRLEITRVPTDDGLTPQILDFYV